MINLPVARQPFATLKRTAFLFLILMALVARVSRAQTTLTSSDGGTSMPGNLFAAVTYINGTASGGAVTLGLSSVGVLLNEALPTASQSLTFLGTGLDQTLGIAGQNGAESTVAFLQNLSLGDGVTLGILNIGASGFGGGLNSSVYVGGTLSMGVSSDFIMISGQAPGFAAGNSSATIGNLDLSGFGSFFSVIAGTGGMGSNGSTGGTGYSGGNASVTVGSLTVSGSGSGFGVNGGTGGAGGTGSTGNGGAGSMGGNASVTVGSLTVSGSGSGFGVNGGTGGAGGTGSTGNGGAGSVGGNASVTVGSLTVSGSGSVFIVNGGKGGGGGNGGTGTGGGGGVGANASVTATDLNLGAGTIFSVMGGAGGTGGNGNISSGPNGAAGSAYVTLGSLNDSGTVTLWGNTADLQVDSGNFSGVITGNETLVVSGPGTFLLNGTNSSTGPTSVQAGGVFGGTGNVIGTATNNGTVLPGNGGAGTLTVGNFTQAASGILAIGVSSTQSTAVSVLGTATLAGTLDVAPYGGFVARHNESVTILDATSISGTFGTVTDGIPKSPVSVVYDPNAVLLDITATMPTFLALGTTANQRSIGAALDNLAGFSPGSALIVTLNNEANSALPGIYDQLSPASLTPLYHMGFSTAQAETGLVSGRISQLFGDTGWASGDVSWNGQSPMFAADMPAAEEASMSKDLKAQRWGVFVNGLGNFGTVTGDGNGPGYQYSTGGTAAGLDYRFSKYFVGGLLLGYNSSGTSQSTGTVNSTGGQAGLYAAWKQGPLHLEALASGGVNSYTTQRSAFGGTASGSTQGQQYSGQLEVNYDLKAGDVTLVPFASGQYTSVSLNAFNETGSQAPLSFGAQSEGYLSGDLGASARLQLDLGGGAALYPMVSAAWEHMYQGNLDSLTANFAGGPNFTVDGPATGTDAAVLGAGVNASFARGMNLYVRYQGKVGQANYTEQNVSGGVNFGF